MRRMVRLGLVVGVVVVGYFGANFVQVWRASRTDGARPADAIVVLGAAQYDGKPSPVLRARLDHAVDLYERGLAPLVAVTGGRRPGDRATEASAAAGYLIGEGVPQASLRLETSGENSWQSLAATARFLMAEGVEQVILVSSPYHALRTEHIADEVGLHGHASPVRNGPEHGVVEVVQMGREALAVGVGRVIGYRRLVNLDQRVEQVRTEVGAS